MYPVAKHVIGRRKLIIFLLSLLFLSACGRSPDPAVLTDQDLQPVDVLFVFSELEQGVDYLSVELTKPQSTITAKSANPDTQSLGVIASASLNLASANGAPSDVTRITGRPSVEVENVLPGEYQVYAYGYNREGGVALYSATRTVTIRTGTGSGVTAKGSESLSVQSHNLTLERAEGVVFIDVGRSQRCA